MMKKGKIALLLLLSLTWGNVSNAQHTMTLKDCIQYALKRNVQVKMQELQKASYAIADDNTHHAYLPQVGIQMGQNFSFGRGLTRSNTYVSRNTSTMNMSIGGTISLFNGFRKPNARKQAYLNLAAATEDLEKVKQNLGLQIAQAYLQVLYQQELIKVSQAQLSLSKIQLDRMKKVYLAQKASALDVSEAENAVAQDELSLVQNQNAWKAALLDLSQLIEMPSPDSLSILPPEKFEMEPITDTPTDIYKKSLRNLPGIKAQDYRIMSANVGIKIARSGYWPSLSLSGGFGTNYYKVNGLKSDGFAEQLRSNFNKSIGLTLNIPLFNRFETRNSIRNAKLQFQMEQTRLDEEKKQLYKEIQTAWYNAVGAKKKYETSMMAAKVAEESFKMMTEKYEYGKANATQYAETKTKYANALSNKLAAQYDYLFRIKILNYYRGNTIN